MIRTQKVKEGIVKKHQTCRGQLIENPVVVVVVVVVFVVVVLNSNSGRPWIGFKGDQMYLH